MDYMAEKALTETASMIGSYGNGIYDPKPETALPHFP
jgi:hypothetical protein